MYVMYNCNKCNTDFIIPTLHIDRMEKQGKYIACPFGHRDIILLDQYGDLTKCMKHDSYKKVQGRVKQRGWG